MSEKAQREVALAVCAGAQSLHTVTFATQSETPVAGRQATQYPGQSGFAPTTPVSGSCQQAEVLKGLGASVLNGYLKLLQSHLKAVTHQGPLVSLGAT